MIPLRDDIPTLRIPWVNYIVIGLCTAVFIKQAGTSDGSEAIVLDYGMIPARITEGNKTLTIDRPVSTPRGPVVERVEVPPSSIPPWLTMVTCMFLHGGFMHCLGNMWFLYIFGDNVEDRYGHLGYALLYLGSGIAAGLGHLAAAPDSTVPTVGASGAIAGVMGAYFVMFRHAQVVTLIPLGVFTQMVAIPAAFFLGIWFVFQIASAAASSPEGGGVAWWAHIGGFAAGLLVTFLLWHAGRLRDPSSRTHRLSPWERRIVPWN